MDRRLPCFVALALLTTGGLRGQTLTYSPLNPQPGNSVNFTVSLFSDCFSSLEDGDLALPGPGNGSIRLTITHNCDCITGQPVSFDEEVGPLALGTYDVELYQRFRQQPGGACCDGDCSPPELLSASTLTVSQNQAIVNLRAEPAQPATGQALTVRFETFCPFAWKTPRIEPSENETLILIDQDPEAPVPPVPCATEPGFPVSFPLAGLPTGAYRLRVRMGASSATLATVAEAVFDVVTASPLLLHQGRFRVQADWSAPGFGAGSAQGVALAEESGYFTFFSPANVELIAKVLNGCQSNQRYWIFLGGLTNVEVTVYVEDTLTGRRETYVNPLGRSFQPVLDTSSFATCP